jgi:hypothetical protein
VFHRVRVPKALVNSSEKCYLSWEQSVRGNSIHSAPCEDARVRPRITEGMLPGFNTDAAASYAPSQDVPIPTSIGDFRKLLRNPQSQELLPGTSQIFPWTLECLDFAADTTDFVSIFVSTFESLDLLVLQGFTSQITAWSNDPARLMAIFWRTSPHLDRRFGIQPERPSP